jgi:NADH-quinone oxidoreductase subunit H
MISFEIPMVVALLIPTLLAGSMSVKTIVESQNIWYIVLAPLAFIVFLISSIAELGRSPFDLNEAESEIVAGFHTEYSGMKFGLFYAGELLHAFTFGGFMAVLFFGGYRFFGLENIHPFVAVFILMVKALIGYWVIMWIKYTVPRIRIDHMLAFNWKFLTPLAFALLVVTAVVHRSLLGAQPWVYALGLLLSNVIVLLATLEILRSSARRQRQAEAPAQPVAEIVSH